MRRGTVVFIGFATVATVVAGILLPSLGSGGSKGGTSSPPVAAAADAAHGTPAPRGRVVVLSRTMPPASTGAHLNARLVSGSVPVSGSEATVLDDLDCAPDAAGISHCRNPLVLADGQRVEVIHPHSMAVVPCLTRGEQVRLVWR